MLENEKKQEQNQTFIVFRLGNELYGVPILSVREIFEIQPIKPVPFAPSYYLGIINLRGKIVSVMDLKKKFRMNSKEGTEEGAPKGFIMVLDLDGNVLGAVIDETLGVKQVEVSEISFNPVQDSSINADYLIGATRIDNDLVTLIDLSRLINFEEIERFNK